MIIRVELSYTHTHSYPADFPTRTQARPLECQQDMIVGFRCVETATGAWPTLPPISHL
jgi:hypothetical protein